MPREISRKITESVITGGFKKWFDALIAMSVQNGAVVTPAPVMPLYSVIGFVHGGKPGATEYGEFIKFHGQFRATNAADGVITDAPTLIIPNFLAEALWAVVNAPGRQSPVQIALKFGVQYDTAANTKYRFRIENLLAPSEHDPLEMLAAAVAAGQPLLEAPASAPTAAPVAVQVPAPTAAPASGKRK